MAERRGKAGAVAGGVLIGLVALILIVAAGAKLVQAPRLITELTSFGFDRPWIDALGVIELASALLFALPRTRRLGLLLATGFLGGAIATHIQHGESPAEPAIVLALGWVGMWLRNPDTFWDRRGPATPRGQEAL